MTRMTRSSPGRLVYLRALCGTATPSTAARTPKRSTGAPASTRPPTASSSSTCPGQRVILRSHGRRRHRADPFPAARRQGEGHRLRPLHGRHEPDRAAAREASLRRPHARPDRLDRPEPGAGHAGRAGGRHPRGRTGRALRGPCPGPPPVRERAGAVRGGRRRGGCRSHAGARRRGCGRDRDRVRAAFAGQRHRGRRSSRTRP